MEEYDVIVSGYGPTGQAAASLLARMGHSVAVFERWPNMYGLPRLCSLDGEACRIVQAAGDVDEALADSSEVRYYNLVDAQGDILIEINFEDTRVCGFYDRMSMYQPDVEATMDRAARERGVEVFQGWEVKGFEQDDDGVTVRVEPHSRGYEGAPEPPRTYRARFVIGADGARSAVRNQIGADREDFGFREGFLSVDVKRKGDYQFSSGTAMSICDPQRNVSVIPIGQNRMRFEFLVNPDDDNTELLTPDVGYHFLNTAWGITADDVEIYRQVIYPFEAKVAHDWREGRVLLAGDAAHLMPPFAGQGACSGMRDSNNLAWKVDLVLRGLAPIELLDTYTAERRPHVRFITIGAVEVGKVACTRDTDVAAQRDAYLKRGGELPPPLAVPDMETGILHRADGGEVEAPAGQLIPQGVVESDGRTGRFDDVVGYGFQLVARGGDPLATLNDEQRALLRELNCAVASIGPGGSVADVANEYGAFFDEQGVDAVLARPDFTIFGGVHSLDDLPALIDDLRDQLQISSLQGTPA
jgi:3-(3-hydroxy-phenyl)propionate hydroxylase